MIRRRTLLASPLALRLPVRAFAQDGGPRPLIVLLEANPWLMVLGSDSPSFALYEDGTAIYRAESGFQWVRLGAEERAALIDRVKPEAIAAQARFYNLSPYMSDQQTTYLFVFGPGGPKTVSIYGALRKPEIRQNLPAPIADAYGVLHGFRHPRATPWLPEKVEVMIWPYEYAPEASVIWPVGWPGLKDPATVKRRDGAYSIYLPSIELPALSAFLKTRSEKGAVEIDGHKWAVSYRFPFPREKDWTVLRDSEPV